MTRVVTRKIADVVLGNGEAVAVEAEYEKDGTLNCLLLKQRPEGVAQEEMIVVAELEYVVQLIAAIRAVLPPRTGDTEADRDDDILNAVERAKALREEAMILSSAAAHLKQARLHGGAS